MSTSEHLLHLKIYMTFTLVAVAVFDYLVSFPREMCYVWRRPWTLVSTIFVCIRYVGLSWAIISGLLESTFVPGPEKVDLTKIVCSLIVAVMGWEYQIFLAASDLVMILRVYAIYNRSKEILCLLLFIYVSQTVISFVFACLYDNPNSHASVTLVQLINITICNKSITYNVPLLSLCVQLPRFILSTTLLVLAIIQAVKQSVDMYKATKEWQPNRYMLLLVRDGLIYFVVTMLYNVLGLVEVALPNAASSLWFLVLGPLSSVALCIMMPRFIIDVRELHVKGLDRRWEGVDGGFGALRPASNSPRSVPAIDFVNTTLGDAGASDGVPLEEGRANVMGEAD